MLLVIPITSSTRNLTQKFASELLKHGPYTRHSLMVVASSDTEDAAKSLKDSLSGEFKSADIFTLSEFAPSSEAQERNYAWVSAAHELQFIRLNQTAWLWLELDTYPLKGEWLSDIETEYNLAKMPVMRASSEGPLKAAVFPPALSSVSSLHSYTARMGKPFEEVCHWEFAKCSHLSELLCGSKAVVGALPIEEPPKPSIDPDVVLPRARRKKVSAE